MLSMHPLYAGSGYTYLTETVASGDRELNPGQDLANYYDSKNGTPPGQWTGAGAERLKVSGNVTEAQMLALFGEGLHPDADAIVAREIEAGSSARRALNKAKLGRLFAENVKDKDPLIKRIDDKVRLARYANGGQISAAKVREITLREAREEWPKRFPNEDGASDRKVLRWAGSLRQKNGQPVAGYDLVFTPQKSVTALWGVGDDRLRETIAKAHRDAVAETLEWVEDNVAFSRKGAGGTTSVSADGLTIAKFDHYDNRAGDPNLHTHCAVSNKVYCPEDGKWRALDGRAMFQMTVSASNIYNAKVVAKLQSAGLAFEATSRGDGKAPVYEVAGVPDSLLREFSRRDVIQERLEVLIDDFRKRNHREPNEVTQLRLAQQATLETRDKKKSPESLDDLRSEWQARARKALGIDGDVGAHLAGLVAEHQPEQREFHFHTAVTETLEKLESKRSSWNSAHIVAAAAQTMTGCTFDSDQHQQEALGAVVAEVRGKRSIRLSGRDVAVSGLVSERGRSLFHDSLSCRYTSPETIFREQQLLDSARTVTPLVATRAQIDAAIKRVEQSSGFALNEGQKLMTHHLLGTGTQVAVAIGPAGAGKTTSMKAVADTWQSMGRNVVGLGPSAAAANVLGSDLGIAGQTIASILTRDQHGLDTGIDQGTLIIVDEAGMASTKDLWKLNEIAKREGAIVRMIGDPAQLSAVESGGMLNVLAQETQAPQLYQVVRFRTEGEAEASLKVREGEVDSLDFYREHDRVHTGSSAGIRGDLLDAWQADMTASKTSLMLATTRRDVAALNREAQRRRLEAGELTDLGRTLTGRDGAALHVGDRIVTRKNDSAIIMIGGEDHGRRIFNGDLWTVDGIDDNGDVLVSHSGTEGRAVLPQSYVTEHVELGYSATVHRAQGMTVDTSHMMLSGHESRELAYVGLSRGKESNHAWIVTEPTLDPEAEHDTRELADVEAVWSQIMARGSDNQAALTHLTDNQADAEQTAADRFAHVRDTLIHSYSTHLIHQHLPALAEEITADADLTGRIEQAVGTALNAGTDIEHIFQAADDRKTSPEATVATVCGALNETTGRQIVGVLPPAFPGHDTGLMEWARTQRTRLVDQRQHNASRLAATGEGLTPYRVQDTSTTVLSEQDAVLAAREQALTRTSEMWRNLSRELSTGAGRNKFLAAHAHLMEHDARIDTVLNRRESLLTATGKRRQRLSQEVAALEATLPPAEQWAGIGARAAQVREQAAHIIRAERVLAQQVEAQSRTTRAELDSLTTSRKVVGDELTRRSQLTEDEYRAEEKTWGRGDAGLTVATATTSREQREQAVATADAATPGTGDVVRMLLDAGDLDTAPSAILARYQLAAERREAAQVDLARPDERPSLLDSLVAQRRELEAELATVTSATADPVESVSDLRQRLRKVTNAEPSLLRDIDRAKMELRSAEQWRADLPEPPKGLFVSAAKKREAQERLDLADRQITERHRTVDVLMDQHRQMLDGLPPREQWDELMRKRPTPVAQDRTFELRTRITDLDTRIMKARADQRATPPPAPPTAAPPSPTVRHTPIHDRDL